jgi:S-adenosylmethionine hydrolase
MASSIALLTDFGLHDWYVGVMKGVILAINPGAAIIDITHSVPPQDVEAASFALLASYMYLPAGTVVAVVVDPGVGGRRRVLCAESGGRLYVFPDNGVLTEVLDREGFENLFCVENHEFFLEHVSATFHGRDIFAPVAAHLSMGAAADSLGPATRDYERIKIAGPRIGDDHVIIRVRWIDRFGNLLTDCSADLVDGISRRWGGVAIDLGAHGAVGMAATYESAEPGHALGLVGSSGYLEISVREGSAARVLGLMLGDTIVLRKP